MPGGELLAAALWMILLKRLPCRVARDLACEQAYVPVGRGPSYRPELERETSVPYLTSLFGPTYGTWWMMQESRADLELVAFVLQSA